MSDYPIWWDTTLTVYNKFEDPQTQVISWYRTVIDNCFWKYTGDKINIGETVLETNNIICRIPENDLFVEKYKWIQLPNDKMSQYFTLGAGDIIIKGEVNDVVNEYSSGYRSSDLVAKYKNLQGCMEVQQITLNTGIGRNNPHYFVKGI
ncbi:MAG: hypothetical protein J6N95_02940 [Bacilli bacterium]|nr:hypothetical protein [Bacilli bacterium]